MIQEIFNNIVSLINIFIFTIFTQNLIYKSSYT